MTAPPVDPDVDLTALPYFPLLRRRLFRSEFHLKSTDSEWRAGVTLWVRSFDQQPAGSLPNDDKQLQAIAGLARQTAKWRKVRDMALRGWALYDDGRLYHETVAEVVNFAVDNRKPRSKRDRTGREPQAKSTADFCERTRKDGNLNILKTKTKLPAHAREAQTPVTNGHALGDEDFLDQNWNPLGHSVPLAAHAPPKPASPGLKAKRRELLRMKLLRFVDATMRDADRRKAIAGLCGTDPDHTDQWWLDTLDIRMRAARWDDVA